MKPQECCVLIPSLSPDERLPRYVEELLAARYGLILVVDDGSAPEYQEIFERLSRMDGCHVLHHDVNRGKGQALRTGFQFIMEKTKIRGLVTADADGQHTVPDTLKLTAQLSDTEELLLGSRDFSLKSKQVPPKSRMGNRITSVVFRLFYGKWLPDTQTGLRAFPSSLIPFMLNVKGDRFEYEMNQLIHCAERKIAMRAVGIETVYHDENKGSHFHPLRDSWRIYKLLLGSFFRYSAASILSFLLDYLVLSLLMFWVFKDQPDMVFLGIPFSVKALIAAPIARLFSAPVNYLLNKNFAFRVKKSNGALKRYILLAAASLLVTTLLFGWLDHFVQVNILHILLKMVIDVGMYMINFRIQKAWVFPAEDK